MKLFQVFIYRSLSVYSFYNIVLDKIFKILNEIKLFKYCMRYISITDYTDEIISILLLQLTLNKVFFKRFKLFKFQSYALQIYILNERFKIYFGSLLNGLCFLLKGLWLILSLIMLKSDFIVYRLYSIFHFFVIV